MQSPSVHTALQFGKNRKCQWVSVTAHLSVPFQLVLRVEHGCTGAPPQQLLQGLLVPAQAGAAESADGEADAAGLAQGLQHGQRWSYIEWLTA